MSNDEIQKEIINALRNNQKVKIEMHQNSVSKEYNTPNNDSTENNQFYEGPIIEVRLFRTSYTMIFLFTLMTLNKRLDFVSTTIKNVQIL